MNVPWCLHTPHPDARIEARARAIYLERNGAAGGIWEANETPQVWWTLAEQQLCDEAVRAIDVDALADALMNIHARPVPTTRQWSRPESQREWFREVAIQLIERFPGLGAPPPPTPSPPTPAPAALLSEDALWALAKRYATEAMAEIGELQLSRMASGGPGATQIIRAAVVGAVREALGVSDER